MTVFKATNGQMECTLGTGIFAYRLGVPAYADGSRCGGTGLHACEYVADCLQYYGLGAGNRFFRAEASGDIAEDGKDTRIACTELTLLAELSNRDIAREAMLYMLRHPRRDGWQRTGRMVAIKEDAAEAADRDGIAIARGGAPRVRGCKGAHLGLVVETQQGIVAARLFDVDGDTVRAGVWYTLDGLEKTAERAGT